MDRRVKVRAPINIALVKYWGKRDEELILPLHDSISITLSTEALGTTTTILAGPSLCDTTLTIDGTIYPIAEGDRTWQCICAAKRVAMERNTCDPKILDWHLQVDSWNDVPTASGLASSASGYAALAYALMHLYNLVSPNGPQKEIETLSFIARLGSGSACRSLLGGFVKWVAGNSRDGSDSIIKQLSSDIPLHALIFVESAGRKAVPSTAGMASTVQTSALFQARINTVLPARLESMQQAIQTKDISTIFHITMQDAMQLHSVCMDTWPPVIYLNDFSIWMIRLVHYYCPTPPYTLAYTFDAGPHPVLLFSDLEIMYTFISLIQAITRSLISFQGPSIDTHWDLPSTLVDNAPVPRNPLGPITCYICAIGSGPVRLS